MQQKAFTLLNRGMNRDLSISKAGESSAYENHNIRITAVDNDTLLSVTNERGNTQIVLGDYVNIVGNLVGWNVLNNHIILFTHDDDKDYIYRIDYNSEGDGTFHMVAGSQEGKPLYSGNLGFSLDNPIESVVYFETDAIQKIYWIDGVNVLRFMNFMADDEEISRWDDTYFDSNRQADFGVKATITKDNSGNTRANGVVQYLLTYYNKHGQETGYVWASDLVYLSPTTVGGSADGTNSNKVTIELYNLDESFTNYRVYSIFRSSLNGTPVGYIVADGLVSEANDKTVTIETPSKVIETQVTTAVFDETTPISNEFVSRPSLEEVASQLIVPSKTVTETRKSVTVVDDGAHLISEDVQRLLYLGSQAVKAGTLTHKDQTLFLGDIQSIGKKDYGTLEADIKKMYDQETGLCNDGVIKFRWSDGTGNDISDIPYNLDSGTYDYQSQLNLTSSQILSFKGGELYRFALTFRRKDGTMTEAFWIGDAKNELYPVVDASNGYIKRIVVECIIPQDVISDMEKAELETAQLMIAEATYADRSVKAQGIINPTVFNVWDRYNKRVFSEASWITRPRNSGFAWKHFEPIHNSTSSTGEIDCNYWETDSAPTPYYQMSGTKYIDEFDGIADGDYRMILYAIRRDGAAKSYSCAVIVFSADTSRTGTTLFSKVFSEEEFSELNKDKEFGADDGTYTVKMTTTGLYTSPTQNDSARSLYTLVKAACISELGLQSDSIVGEQKFVDWCNGLSKKEDAAFNYKLPNAKYGDVRLALNNNGSPSASCWEDLSSPVGRSDYDYVPAYYRKHLMFIDENIVTLNSPEITYEAASFDNAENYKLRIVGVARVTSTTGDYTIDATPGKLPGENLIREKFIGDTDGIISWPLWKEYSLKLKLGETDAPSNVKQRTSDDYEWLDESVVYWLHMWNHSGKINGYTDSENGDYSRLNAKTFANLRYSYETIYNTDRNNDWTSDIPSGGLRMFNYTSSQYVGVKVGSKTTFYDANIQQSLLPPGTHKYKVLYSENSPETTSELIGNLAWLYLDSPVQIDYLSSPHAVIALPTTESTGVYTQTILPYMGSSSTGPSIPENARLPWRDSSTDRYRFNQSAFSIKRHSNASPFSSDEKYVFIGELYKDFANGEQYGDVQNNRFITAGPQYTLSQLKKNSVIYGNQGDTYFQRWDCLKTKPYSVTDATNSVIDITSVLVETHINLDGRTDNQRGNGYIASIDTAKHGTLNNVYTQQNNFFAQRDLDEDFNLDSYRSSITWTLQKSDSAEIDEWSHITLASSLKLDGDKGICRALRRFQNSIIAFQDKGIAEILFNSRTQLSTTDGVPVELANSGKVDGKRYITNKFGCVNKWSITEGKAALYFVDNINKAFCAFNGNIDNLSSRLGFDVWFRRSNELSQWTPNKFRYEESNSIVSFYDRIHSDVYLIKNSKDDEPCLVYNETLGAFTSFYDYDKVPMMTNVDDRFISYRDGILWLQNEGYYCNFFGKQYDFWTRYRVTPDPYGDKIWTNIDYRADFYHVLGGDRYVTFNIPKEDELINADRYNYLQDSYKENETFSSYKVWDEYQTTGDVLTSTNTSKIDPVRKKFRIWRIAIPRALKDKTNIHGLDRIRNPWVNVEFRKNVTDNKLLMQLHDIVIKYFE